MYSIKIQQSCSKKACVQIWSQEFRTKSHQDGNKSIQNVAQFKHSGMTLTNQNCIHEEIRKTGLKQCLLP
jgi:hypothetical protein